MKHPFRVTFLEALKSPTKQSGKTFAHVTCINGAQRKILEGLTGKKPDPLHLFFPKEQTNPYSLNSIQTAIQILDKEVKTQFNLPARNSCFSDSNRGRMCFIDSCFLLHTASFGIEDCLSTLYAEGRESSDKNSLKIAVFHEDPRAMLDLALLLKDEGDSEGYNTLVEKSALGGIAEAMGLLSIQFRDEGDTKKARFWREKAAQAGQPLSMFELALELKSEGNQAGYLKWTEQAALKWNKAAMCVWATCLAEQGLFEKARHYASEAFKKGYPNGLVVEAIIVAKQKKDDEAERLFKKAVSLNVEDAELYYARFLYGIDRQKEAEAYLEFYETVISAEEVIQAEDLPDTISQQVLSQIKSQEHGQEISTSKTLVQASTTGSAASAAVAPEQDDIDNVWMQAPFSKATRKVDTRFQENPISKRHERYIARAQKKEEQMLKEGSFKKTSRTTKTFEDVAVLALPDALVDVLGEHEIKIQGLISSLANGERRGRLEPLKGTNAWSVRLTKGVRVIFEILEGHPQKGVTKIKILAANKEHYEDLNKLVSATKIPVIVDWNHKLSIKKEADTKPL